MSATEAVFDPIRYKQTTRAQWETAAEAWDRWGDLLANWLGPVTETMFDMASIGPGQKVLDVAAGAGEQTLAVARRVGSDGEVLATDISPSILGYAARNARDAGYDNVRTRELDGESLHELPANSYDAVISRVGLIYFPDQQKALAGMHHALKPGGRIAALVYGTAELNSFFSLPVSIIRRRAQLPPPLPGQPGPFSLGADGVLEKTLTDAGFRDVQVKAVDAPVRVPSASDCLNFEKESFGALHQMLSGLTDPERDEAWQEIEEALGAYQGPDGFNGPCQMVIGVGTK